MNFNFSVGYLTSSFFLSVIGMAFFVFGKRQRLPVPFLTGVALMGLPYVLGNALLLTLVGSGIGALGFAFRHVGS